MVAHRKFSIAETNHFIPSRYPILENNLREIVLQLVNEPACKTDMLISYVRNRSINSKQAVDHPQLARDISTGLLPLHMMEALFEAGRNSPPFKKELEEHIRGRFMTSDLGTHY